MTQTSEETEQFTGLILLTGTDRSGIAASLFETLAPFSVTILDIEQIVINNRLILTVLIGANPAHQRAIEEDLNACASQLDVDIATLFGKAPLAPLAKDLIEVRISSPKLRPQTVALVSEAVSECDGNIVRIIRVSEDPLAISLTISGTSKSQLDSALGALTFEYASVVEVNVL
jgi:phosphoserine phosphatase